MLLPPAQLLVAARFHVIQAASCRVQAAAPVSCQLSPARGPLRARPRPQPGRTPWAAQTVIANRTAQRRLRRAPSAAAGSLHHRRRRQAAAPAPPAAGAAPAPRSRHTAPAARPAARRRPPRPGPPPRPPVRLRGRAHRPRRAARPASAATPGGGGGAGWQAGCAWLAAAAGRKGMGGAVNADCVAVPAFPANPARHLCRFGVARGRPRHLAVPPRFPQLAAGVPARNGGDRPLFVDARTRAPARAGRRGGRERQQALLGRRRAARVVAVSLS
jgi:hypothetical protein